MVEWVVKFDSLGTTFILRIFEAKNWVDLFGNFEDPIDELVKEFYSNARYTGVELKCWVCEKEFTINPDYIAKVLRITRPTNVDITPNVYRQPQIQDILQVLGSDHEVSSKDTSIGTTKLHLNWILSSWSCSLTCIHSQTLHSATLEKLSSYMISSLELQLTYVPTSFRSLGKLRLDQQHEHVFPFAILLWRSWFLKE